MRPLVIAPALAFRGRRRLGVVAAKPFRNVVVIKLFAPDHAGECLALDVARVWISEILLEAGVEVVGFAAALLSDGIEVRKRLADGLICEANAERCGMTGRNFQVVM